MSFTEQAFTFSCNGETLLGISALPKHAREIGVLMVLGGPQYRVGSHRQYLLLSRALASAGYTSMRFDYRGMGDSTGQQRNFEHVNEDISAAIETFFSCCPQVKRLVIWGLCDGASASLLYWNAIRDIRVAGLCLLNPWVRSDITLAKTQIKHYYGQRLQQWEFWRKLLSGRLGVFKALAGFIDNLASSRQTAMQGKGGNQPFFQEIMARALRNFDGAVLLILSGNDYTAKEFMEYAATSHDLLVAMKKSALVRADIAEADHTFSTAKWRAEVEALTVTWLDGL